MIQYMRILNYIKVLYYSFLLWIESHGSEAKSDGFVLPDLTVREQTRKNEKLRRGVRHLVKWMRNMTPAERQKLKESDNILTQSGRSKELTTMEKLDRARASAKFVQGPRREGEEAMAETFVKNQTKYKLNAQKREVYRNMQKGLIDSKLASVELKRINVELKKYE